MTATFPTPIRDGLLVELPWLRELIACMTGIPNPMNRDLQLIIDPTERHSYYCFRPECMFSDGKNIVFRGTWSECVTDPGETWQGGCVLIPIVADEVFYTTAQLYPDDAFVPLQTPSVVVMQ